MADMLLEMRAAFYGKVKGKNEPDALFQEKHDAKMIREDHNAMANLSPRGYQVHWAPDKYMQRLGTDRGLDLPSPMKD